MEIINNNKNENKCIHNEKNKDIDNKNILKKDEKFSSKTNLKNNSIKNILNIEEITKNLKKEKDKFIRLFAEFENYKKRIQKERLEIFNIASENIIIKLISVLDDFERGSKEISKFKGMILIKEKFVKILEEKGLKKTLIKKGDNFNTDFHEAITQSSVEDKSLKGKIIDIIESGYILGNKVIRHAKVIVGK